MYRYFIKRVILLIPILLGVSLMVFSILYFVPGDPARVILGDRATAEDVAQLNKELGFDRPFLERYADYIYNSFLRFDLGTSYRTSQPVRSEIASRFPVSLRVASISILISVIIGVPLGVISAVKQYSWIDNISRFVSIFIASVPIFWLGMILIFIFSLNLKILPSSGVGSWKNYILPTLALGLPQAGMVLRFTRSSMLETVRQDYVRTAKSKGVPNGVVIKDHAFKNALLPIITIVGDSFGGLIGGSVITESVFSLPGIGTMLVNGIRTKDVPIVMGGTLFFALVFALIMLAVDILYSLVDPRIKAKYEV